MLNDLNSLSWLKGQSNKQILTWYFYHPWSKYDAHVFHIILWWCGCMRYRQNICAQDTQLYIKPSNRVYELYKLRTLTWSGSSLSLSISSLSSTGFFKYSLIAFYLFTILCESTLTMKSRLLLIFIFHYHIVDCALLYFRLTQ